MKMDEEKKNSVPEEESDQLFPDAEKAEQPGQGAPDGGGDAGRPDETAELKKQLAEVNDKYLRLAAEYDNYRKRSAKEKGDAYADAYADAVKAFLPLADSLDKALEFTPDDDGIKALSKQFYDSCAKIGVTAIESDGQPFDPALHNAIMHEDDEAKGENLIVQTFCKGYKLGEKVIRHAMVKVVN